MGHGNEPVTTLDYPEHLYHDPFDTDRLISAARVAADAMEAVDLPSHRLERAAARLRACLASFPEEPPPISPVLTLVEAREHLDAASNPVPLCFVCGVVTAAGLVDGTLYCAACDARENGQDEPTPLGGGRWATDAEWAARPLTEPDGKEVL